MISKIAVIGGGTMGHGIAEVFAMSGLDVKIYESSPVIREMVFSQIKSELSFMAENAFLKYNDIDAILNRIQVYDSLRETVYDADYVIEAVPEVLSLKNKIFSEIDGYCKPDAIFASNTSSLALKDMLNSVSPARQERMMICHWYNPAHLMPIAELSFFGNMPLHIYKTVETLYKNAGKQVVKVLKDVPGLVANRIQQAVAREVFWLIENGIAEPEDIDRGLKFGPAFRYATTGQLEVADMGGLDIWCTVGDNLLSVMDNRTDANPVLREKVAQGKLGMKSGEGFFNYSASEIEGKKNAFNKRLMTQLKTIKYYI